MRINLVVGRLLFAFASSAVVIISGGGAAFVSKPVGSTYLILWIALWVSQAKRQRGIPSEYDRKQCAVYLAGAVCIPFLIVVVPWEYTNFAGPIPRDGPLAWIGLIIFASGILLVRAAMRALGRLYTSYLGIQADHRLVSSGPYRYIRHRATWLR